MAAASTDRVFERRLAALANCGEPGLLRDGQKGLEKESLRVSPRGQIAQTPHPAALGSALTSPSITTDYSEALIELVTPPFSESWELLQYLCDLHQFVYRNLGDELLWATSMPCVLGGDESIPIASYGSSNIGRMKHVYRQGLGLRYGRAMQAISGVHFNFSFGERFWPVLHEAWHAKSRGRAFVDEAYFALLRNYRRHGWLVLYLFGASPAMCKSFFAGREQAPGLQELDRHTLYLPHATTLRMSDLGYRNKSQADVSVSVNSLEEYVRDLSKLISTPSPEFGRFGVQVGDEWRQLSGNVLQIENEYYSFIRPKRVPRRGERPTRALERGGVQYVEMRSLDVGLFDPVGVNRHTLHFLEAFAALCVLKESPPVGRSEEHVLDANQVLVARRGREPGLTLQVGTGQRGLKSWALQLLDEMEGLCELLDGDDDRRPYRTALAVQRERVADPGATPSAHLLDELRTGGEAFFQFALRLSRQHRDYFAELYPPNRAQLEAFGHEAAESHRAQRGMEEADDLPFGDYVARWFSA